MKTEVRVSLKDQEWLCVIWALGCLAHQHAGKKLDFLKKYLHNDLPTLTMMRNELFSLVSLLT